MEPPYWYYPVRQAFGKALLKSDRFQEAEAIFREDLRQHPNNGWSLNGLGKRLQAQGDNQKASEVQQQFQKAWSRADINL